MTDRLQSLTVFLEREYRDDEDALAQIEMCIHCIRGVSSVERGPITELEAYIERDRVRRELSLLVFEVLVNRDPEFVSEVKSSFSKLKDRRGY